MTIVSSGQDFEVLNVSANGSSFVAVTFSEKINSVVLQSRASADFYVSHDSTGTNYFTVKSGSSLSLDVAVGKTIPCYVKGSGSQTIEAIGAF